MIISQLRRILSNCNFRDCPNVARIWCFYATPPIIALSDMKKSHLDDSLNRIFNRLIVPTGMSAEASAKVLAACRRAIHKFSGLSAFRDAVRKSLVSEGLATPADFAADREGLSNVASLDWLQLLFNTSIEQANTFAYYQQYVSDGTTINAYPAAKLILRGGEKIKHARHGEAEGEIRRWDDTAFWLFQNAADIGGFDVPWGPFGFDSYMVAEPVPRSTTDAMGLTTRGEKVAPLDLTPWAVDAPARISAGAGARLDEAPDDIALEARRRLVEQFGPHVIGPDGNPTLEFARSLVRK
jgi:hypothetical protein